MFFNPCAFKPREHLFPAGHGEEKIEQSAANLGSRPAAEIIIGCRYPQPLDQGAAVDREIPGGEEFCHSAQHQPITAIADSLRALLSQDPVGSELWAALAWLAGITLLAWALAARIYRGKTTS